MKHHVSDVDCQDVRDACQSYGGVVEFWQKIYPEILPKLYDIFKTFENNVEFKVFYRSA